MRSMLLSDHSGPTDAASRIGIHAYEFKLVANTRSGAQTATN